MPLRYAYTQPNGTVAIVNAAPKRDLEKVLGALTQEEYEAHVIDRSNLGGAVALTRLPDDWTPPDIDRTFRNAWVIDGSGKTSVDMPKARDIHRQRLRRLRDPKFEPLERAQRTALVSGDRAQAAAIETQLQALRDATADPAIEAAQTPDELKAVIPAVLK